uniref:ADP-ribosyl cyclase/cyclic ADP-ribose hydrolase n=1 Tax=Fundulus heteroclitus TaxID=8078 RepID=A0A3Q2SRL8_FUNHE
MERGEVRSLEKRRRRRGLTMAAILAVLLLLIIAIILGVTLTRNDDEFERMFIARCRMFRGLGKPSGDNCQSIWDVFQQAYINRDPCEVPPEAYDGVIAAVPFDSTCNTTVFWSETKAVVHDFTEKKDCFKTVEDFLLGSVLDDLVWCGKKGSNETFTTDCPEQCQKNPVRSFWKRVSVAFGGTACGNVTVMLNGSLPTPFNEASMFGSDVLKTFTSPKVKQLNVVLVTQENSVTNCTNESLGNLKMKLNKGIGYRCSEVSQSKIEWCASAPEKPCSLCW